MPKQKQGSSSKAPTPASAAKDDPEIHIEGPGAPDVPDVAVPDLPEIIMTQEPSQDHPKAPSPEAATAPTAAEQPAAQASVAPPAPQPGGQAAPAQPPAPAPPPLTAQEQRIVDAVIAHIDPLLVKLKEIAEQADTSRAKQSQEQGVHDYEALLDQMSQQMNQRIERKIAHMQTFIAKRG